jgi:hydrogenase nickel incorporation protein HypA/HybF
MGQVARVAVEQQATQVSEVELGIGPLSGVEPELLRRAWPLASAGSIAADATLLINTLPVRVHCSRCERDSDALANRLICGHCGEWRTRLISGDELLLVSVSVERQQELAHV